MWLGLPPHTPPLILGVRVPVPTLLIVALITGVNNNIVKKYNLSKLTDAQRQQFNEANASVQAALVIAWSLEEIQGSGGYGAGGDRLRKQRATFKGTEYFKQILIPATPSIFEEWQAVMVGEEFNEMKFIKTSSLEFFFNSIADDQDAGIPFPVTYSVNADNDTILTANSGLGFNSYTSQLDDVSHECIGVKEYPRELKQYSKKKKAELATT